RRIEIVDQTGERKVRVAVKDDLADLATAGTDDILAVQVEFAEIRVGSGTVGGNDLRDHSVKVIVVGEGIQVSDGLALLAHGDDAHGDASCSWQPSGAIDRGELIGVVAHHTA